MSETRSIVFSYRKHSDYVKTLQIHDIMVTLWIGCHWRPTSPISKPWHGLPMRTHWNCRLWNTRWTWSRFQSRPFKCGIVVGRVHFWCDNEHYWPVRYKIMAFRYTKNTNLDRGSARNVHEHIIGAWTLSKFKLIVHPHHMSVIKFENVLWK